MAVADHNDLAALGVHPRNFQMNLGDEWASGVEHAQTPTSGFLLHGKRHAMGAEDDSGPIGDFVEILDENCAACAQVIDDVAVVDDFVPHVNGCPVKGKRTLDGLDGALDPRTETAWVGKKDFDGRFRHGWIIFGLAESLMQQGFYRLR